MFVKIEQRVPTYILYKYYILCVKKNNQLINSFLISSWYNGQRSKECIGSKRINDGYGYFNFVWL